MTQAIKNAINAFSYEKVEALKEAEEIVTTEMLDNWEVELHDIMKKADQKIGKSRIRELMVCYILNEFGVEIFGTKSSTWKAGEISETSIRKMKNQRKKGFNDLKIVKAAK